MDQQYIIFDEILDEYETDVIKKAPKKESMWLETLMNITLILSAVVFSGGTIYFTFKENLAGEWILIGTVVAVAMITIVVNEVQYWNQRGERLERYRERLKILKEVLKNKGWDSEKKIELLIQWCDSYSRMESPWFKELEPLRKIFTVCMLPIIAIAFQVMYEEQEDQQVEWLIMALLMGILAGVIAFVLLPEIKNVLNKKGKLATQMKNDLKHIQLANLLGVKNPEKEQTLVQKDEEENGQKRTFRRRYVWIKILIVCVLIPSINSLLLSQTYLFERYVNMTCFVLGIFIFGGLIIINYKLTQRISKTYLVGIIFISLINFYESKDVIFSEELLYVRAGLFLAVVSLGLWVVWIARTKIIEGFMKYLAISLLMVVLNFGGFYESLYSIYFPYGQEGFSIDQGMTYSQAVMPMDFIYYSADTFFGTDISDVRINYIDYMRGYDESSQEKKYIEKYEGAELTNRIIKISSLLESIIYLVYISIIVMGAGSEIKKEV